MFGFGLNAKDSLGIKEDKVNKPVKSEHFGEIVDALTNTCTIDRSGKLYLNGVEEKRIASRAKKATSGHDSHYVIDAAGDLWSWGNNYCGQLGHGDRVDRLAPKKIQKLKGKHVKEVSVGGGGVSERTVTVACITDNNACFVFGNCILFDLESEVTKPIKLGRSMKSIAVGHFSDRIGHALMIDTADKVYAVGLNSCGELGVGDEKARPSWTKVTNLTGHPIKVQCGWHSSAVLTTTGVFVWGLHFGGTTPKLIDLASVTDISMNGPHILALTTNGELYAWGSNIMGECGVGSSDKRIDEPTRVRGTEDYHIRQISAGSFYSLLCCEPKSQKNAH